MNLKEAIEYLEPFKDSTWSPKGQEALQAVLPAAKTQLPKTKTVYGVDVYYRDGKIVRTDANNAPGNFLYYTDRNMRDNFVKSLIEIRNVIRVDLVEFEVPA